MKCPECGGVGRIHYGEEWCSACNGTGEIVTNEEWFCQLSTEEKAKVLYRKSHKNFIRALNGKMPITSKEWEMWLKQLHTEKE